MVLDCAGGGTVEETNVQQYSENGTTAQQWYLRKVNDGKGAEYYQIVSAASNLVLDVLGANSGNGANVQLYRANGTLAQLWLLKRCEAVVEDGAYIIESTLPGGYVVDIAGGVGADRAAAQIYQDNGTLAQTYALNYESSTGYYIVTSYSSGKVLDIENGTPSEGAFVQQYVSNGTRAQKWQLVANPDNTITFVSAISGLALDVVGGQAANGIRLQQYGLNGTLAQRFALKATEPVFVGGLVNILNGANANLVADVCDGSRSEGAGLQLYASNQTFAQKYLIEADASNGYVIKCIVSGLLVSVNDQNEVFQSQKSDLYAQHWEITPTSNGHFVLATLGADLILGINGVVAPQTALSGLSSVIGLSSMWNMAQSAFLENGLYVIAALENDDCVLDVSGASIEWGGNIQLWEANGSNAQKFYITHQGDDVYTLTNIWSLLNVDVAGASVDSGANIQQFQRNDTNAQKWRAVWDGAGGVVFQSMLGNLALGCDNLLRGSNVYTVSFDLLANNQRFRLSETSMVPITTANRIELLDTIDGSDLDVFNSMSGLSQQTFDALYDALGAYGGTAVGFLMLDLNSGAGVSYNIDRAFYSASTIKGPYVAALNKYQPWLLQSWSGAMFDAINVSSNEAYATLRSNLGADALAQLINDTHAWGFDWSRWYVNYSPRQLAKLWVGMADYFMSDQANAAWCRDVFDSNSVITSRLALSGKGCTVYAKSGWLTGGPTVHNEGCIVMDGDHPYLMVVMTEEPYWSSWKMANLMNALDRAHSEIAR